MKLPTQLQNTDFRFIRIQSKSKAPISGISWKKNLLTHRQIEKWKNNYGVVGGHGDLRILDIDNIEMLGKFDMMQTFTVETGGGGRHLFFISDYDTNHVLPGVGELRSKNYYVVGANSTHPNGNKYKVVKDLPIMRIEGKNLKKIIEPYIKSATTAITDAKKPSDKSRSGIEFGEVFRLIEKGWNKERIFERMMNFDKWSKAVVQYREMTYNNALQAANKKSKSDDLQTAVYSLLAQRKRDEATEMLVKDIEENYTVYTTRNDERPELWIYSNGIYAPNGQSVIKEHLRKILGDVYTSHISGLVIEKIKADTFIDSQELFEESPVEEIPVQNGILNIFTRELLPFTPDKRFFNKLPVTYNPDADCPAIKKHLHNVLVTEDDVNILQETAGYSLLRDAKFETAQIWFGDGSNGKGKTQELFKRFVGVENVSAVTLRQLEKDRFSKALLHKKLLNLAGEVGSKPLKDTEAFKTITGRDLIEADRKFKDTIKFVNYAKPIFSANRIPITHDRTPAFWRRWIMVIFPYTFVDADKVDKSNPNHKVKDLEIISKIATQEELDGFLNFALDGLDRLMKQKRFTENEATKDIKNHWIRMSNSFEGFFMDCMELDDSNEIKASVQKLYLNYCRVHKTKPVGTKDVKEVMYENGVGEDRITIGDIKRYVWVGVKFKDGAYEDYGIYSPSKIMKFNIGKKTVVPTVPSKKTLEDKLVEKDKSYKKFVDKRKKNKKGKKKPKKMGRK